MKAKIILAKNYEITANGYPVLLELSHKQKRKRKTIGHAFAVHWDLDKNRPLSKHPEYHLLMPLVLEYKSKIAAVNLGNYDFDTAAGVLFSVGPGNETDTNQVFYDAAIKYADSTRNGKLYRTVLNSFNHYYKNIYIDEITPAVVKNYMAILLKTNKPNGVHTYLRTLNALYNKVSENKNPFTGVRPKKVKTVNKGLIDADVWRIATTRSFVNKYDGRNTNVTINYDRYYWLLMFYLGGLDMVDLAALRYDKHVVNGRIEFYRHKGGTNAFVSNRIFGQAREILSLFDCKPYLVPIYKYKDYNSFLGKFNKRFNINTQDLNLSRKPLTKSARYTFINRAKNLLIDERITMEIVGHEQKHTHSIYTGNFTNAMRDEAHKKIINLAAGPEL